MRRLRLLFTLSTLSTLPVVSFAEEYQAPKFKLSGTNNKVIIKKENFKNTNKIEDTAVSERNIASEVKDEDIYEEAYRDRTPSSQIEEENKDRDVSSMENKKNEFQEVKSNKDQNYWKFKPVRRTRDHR